MLRNLSSQPSFRHYAKAAISTSARLTLQLVPPLARQPRQLQRKIDQLPRRRSRTMSCEDCAKPAAAEKGAFWAGEPTGKEVKLNGITVYLAQPASSAGKAVIMIPDVYGASCRTPPPCG